MIVLLVCVRNRVIPRQKFAKRRAGADLKAVWQAPTTTNRDRKHLLRCLISEVVVLVDRERLVADLTIRWTGGASTKLTSPLNRTGGHRYVTSEQVNELVRQVAPYYTDEQIAFMLNMRHLRTGGGNCLQGSASGSRARDAWSSSGRPGELARCERSELDECRPGS